MPGVEGLSKNIRVRSVVGRFLEHTRIFYFRNERDTQVYLSSADWMSRNLLRRVEVAFPVRAPALKRRVLREGLYPYLKDNVDAWELGADGHYRRRKPRTRTTRSSAQDMLLHTLAEVAAPTSKEVREADPDPQLGSESN